jgi:hypothetical protein
MRKNRLVIKTILLSALAAVIFDAEATVATAIVTVNVVPASSFSVSNNIALSIPAETGNDTQQTQTDSKQIAISSLNNTDPVKVIVSSGNSNIYDISISSESVLTGPASTDRLTINNMKIDSNPPSLNTAEQELLIDGIVIMPDSNNTGAYRGTTEITLNYN